MEKVLGCPPIRPSVESLRAHFLERNETPPIQNEDALIFEQLHGETQKDAAVLIPVVALDSGLELLLTRRADHLREHAGQISFPGGQIEQEDRSPEAAALRETEEEIGLGPEHIEIIGRLGDYFTISGFRVTPVVGLVQRPVELTPQPDEVAEVLCAPLPELLNPAGYRLEQYHHGEIVRSYYSTYHQGHRIWGITAGIIIGLYQELAITHL